MKFPTPLAEDNAPSQILPSKLKWLRKKKKNVPTTQFSMPKLEKPPLQLAGSDVDCGLTNANPLWTSKYSLRGCTSEFLGNKEEANYVNFHIVKETQMHAHEALL